MKPRSLLVILSLLVCFSTLVGGYFCLSSLPRAARFILPLIMVMIGLLVLFLYRRCGSELSLYKSAEAAGKESEKKYRDILENMEDGYFEVDLSGKFTYANTTAALQFGITKEQMVGTNFSEYGKEREVKRLFETFNKMCKSGKPLNQVDYLLIAPDGTEKHMEITASLIRDTQGNPIGFGGVNRDVTERRKAEEALRQNEEKYRTILDNVEAGYYELDLAGNITEGTDIAAIILGSSSELKSTELIGKNYAEFCDEENAKALFEIYHNVYMTGEPAKEVEWNITASDGTKICTETSAALMRDADGVPIGFRGILRDVTERKRTEEALRQNEEKYRTILDNVEVAYYELDLAGNITGGMDPAGSPFGGSREEFVGRNFTEFCDEANAQALFETYHNVYLTGEPAKEVEWNITAPDGTKIFTEASAALMRDADGEPIGFRGIIRDVSERKQAEKALRQSEERLKLAIEGGDLGFWDMNLKTQKGIVNERWAEMLGYTMAEVQDVQSAWENSIHPEDRERVLEEGRKYRAGETTDYEIEYRAVTTQGNIKWLVTRGAAVEWDKQGVPTRMVGTVKDITARKIDEQEIKNSEQRLSQIINFLPDPTFVIDRESKVLAWNKAIKELTGIEPNSILGKGNYEYAIPFYGERRPMLIDLLFKPDKTIEKQYLKLTRRGETLFSESFNPGLRPGGVYLAGNAQSLYDDSGEVMGAIETIRDITEQKRTWEALHKARQEVDNANKALKNNLKKLQGAYKIIESQKERMEEELNIGRRIQSSFLPESLPRIDGWDIVAHFQAAGQVSGDFYDAFYLANDSGVGFVIADVCDKGVGAALFMGLFRSLIRAFSELHYGMGLPELLDVGVADHSEQNIEAQQLIDFNHARALEIILSHTNNYIASTHGKSNMFATLFWGIIEPTDGTLSYINGGHESVAVVGPKGIRTTLEPTGPAVGMLPDMVFEAKRIEICPGEFLVAFTDGITEARDAGGELYGEDNLMQLLNLPAESAEDMLSRITTSLAAHTAGAEQSDDITMIVIRRSLQQEKF